MVSVWLVSVPTNTGGVGRGDLFIAVRSMAFVEFEGSIGTPGELVSSGLWISGIVLDSSLSLPLLLKVISADPLTSENISSLSMCRRYCCRRGRVCTEF